MGKLFCWLIWLLLVVGAINWGLFALNMNLFTLRLFEMAPLIVNPIQYIIGAAGVISIIMALFGKCGPSCKSCK